MATRRVNELGRLKLIPKQDNKEGWLVYGWCELTSHRYSGFPHHSLQVKDALFETDKDAEGEISRILSKGNACVILEVEK